LQILIIICEFLLHRIELHTEENKADKAAKNYSVFNQPLRNKQKAENIKNSMFLIL